MHILPSMGRQIWWKLEDEDNLDEHTSSLINYWSHDWLHLHLVRSLEKFMENRVLLGGDCRATHGSFHYRLSTEIYRPPVRT